MLVVINTLMDASLHGRYLVANGRGFGMFVVILVLNFRNTKTSRWSGYEGSILCLT